ncbi:MAG: O-antigen ligase family protein [Acidobacteria bacterium]|nr:O-antigen ligase family protein [Acidobacteriota bacterium]
MTHTTDDLIWERWISLALMGGVVSSLLSIAVSDILFGISILLWLVHCWKRRKLSLKAPPFIAFLWAFLAAVLIAIVFSSDVLISALYLKKFIKFFYVFLIFTYLNRERVEYALKAMVMVLGISAGYGILQYFWLLDINLVNRIDGFMGHWMTFSGQLMLVSVALGGYLLFYQLPQTLAGGQDGTSQEAEKGERMGWLSREVLSLGAGSVLLALLLFVLVLTHTRSAWLGTMGGLLLLLSVYRVRWLLAAILILIALFFALPSGLKERFYSSFDLTDTTTRGRMELLLTAKNMIVAHPWTGLGPNMVSRRYQDYNETDEFETWLYQHLHNNFLQIAAEMGVITLLIWVALWVRLFWDFARFFRDPASDRFLSCLAMSGIGVLVAFLLAGLFEYNFGDSEILILLLFFITIPYVVHGGQEKGA